MEAPSHWETFRHGSDIGVRGVGPTLEEAFEQAGVALCGVVTDPARVAPRTPVEVACEAPDAELLLMDWLNALVFEMATRHMLFSRFEVRLEGDGHLRARAWGERTDVAKHHPAVEVKGATPTNLEVRGVPGGEWTAQCVVDV